MSQLTLEKTCAQCGAPFMERANVGRFQCRMHPGERSDRAPAGATTRLMMRDCCDATTAPSFDGFVGSDGEDVVDDDVHPERTASEDAARRRR